MSWSRLLENLSIIAPKEIDFEIEGVTLIKTSDGEYDVEHLQKKWHISLQVELDDKDMKQLSYVVVRLVPPHTTVYMQPDAHCAGNVFVGLVMCFNNISIPITLISGDIGCGLTLIPIVKEGKHLSRGDISTNEKEYLSLFLWIMRSTLKRGKTAEEGKSINMFLKEAVDFYKNDFDWLKEMKYVLTMCHIDYKSSYEPNPDYTGDDIEQAMVLQYIGRFAQSLGSSGNHFMELSVDKNDYLWLVIHSGSRGIGYKVYSVIADACRTLSGGMEVATGDLAIFYTRAHNALTCFAKLNRAICAIAVLKGMELEWRGDVLATKMRENPLFQQAVEGLDGKEKSVVSNGLLAGLSHNAIKTFINHRDKQYIHVLCKGAIAVSCRSSSSIVALKAGEGCFVWTLVDKDCPWILNEFYNPRHDIYKKYKMLMRIEQTNGGVLLAGHGAGRCQSAKATEQMSTFTDLMDTMHEHGMVGNIAPGILGDSKHAYKKIDEILPSLPLEQAKTSSWLKTLITYKEGLVDGYKKNVLMKCASFIEQTWDLLPEHEKLWMDLNAAKAKMNNAFYEKSDEERRGIAEKYRLTFNPFP